MAAASSDFDIFNLFDTDDIELSQLCEKMDTENNLINTADIKTINFNDLDFLSSDIDDLTLSQICDTIETEYHMTNELNSLKIDQFGDLEIETAMYTLQEVGPSAATGCFMNFARFADPVSDEDVRKLIEGQENQNTKKNTK